MMGKIRVLARATLNGFASRVVARRPPVAHPWFITYHHRLEEIWDNSFTATTTVPTRISKYIGSRLE